MFIDQGRFLSHARDVITGFLPGTNHLDRKPVIDETSIALWYSAQPHLCQQFRQHGYGGVILWQSIRPILFCLFLSLFTQFHSTRTLPQVFPMIPQLGGQSKNPFPGAYQSRSCASPLTAAACSSGGTACRISEDADGSSSHRRSLSRVNTTGIRSWMGRMELFGAVVRIV